MAKIKHTKNELKRQKELLKRFSRYLPTLKLKKQQLQTEIGKIQQALDTFKHEIEQLQKKIHEWVGVFAQPVRIDEYCSLSRVITDVGNVAGIDIPVYKDIEYIEHPYEYMDTPVWVDAGIKAVKGMSALRARSAVAQVQQKILKEELRITVQRVNLFEKVKIPRTREHIRLIRIFLGDMQTAAVVRGKIAKAKIDRKKELATV